MLQALAHHADGDRAAALDILDRAIAAAPEPDSHVRLYLDEGAPMLELLRERAQPSLADPLSRRELEVLQRLDSELTGPQIADELYVSLNTLRTHTKRIFTKLDVNTRAAAVRRARELGLI